MTAADVDPNFILSLPKEVLAGLPAGVPPPDVDPNFSHPPTLVPQLLGVTYTFLFIALFAFSLRMYTKATISRNWKWDDLTISIGFICAIMYAGFVTAGSLNGATGKHIWDLNLIKILESGFLLQSVVTTLLVTPALGLIKSSFFIQYYVLFGSLRWVRICVWIGAILSVLFYVAVTIAAFVLNSPRPDKTLFATITSASYLRFANFSIPTGVIGMLVDWYLLCLPIPAIMGLAMSTTKKLGVLIVFMTGAVAAIASVVTLYYRVKLQQDISDPTWKVGYVHMWAQIEMFAGVAASSMPAVKQFFIRQKPKLELWSSSFMTSVTHLMARSATKKHSSTSLDDHSEKSTVITGHVEMSQRADIPGSTHTQPSLTKTIWLPELPNTQIRVTRDVSITREDCQDGVAISRRSVTPF